MNRLPRLLLWFFTLMFLQAFVFDPLLLGVSYAPLVYVLLLILIPNDWPSWVVLLVGFFIGLCADLIFFSGGVHALACLIVSYARPLLIRAVYRDTLSPKELKLEHEPFVNLFLYAIVLVFAHHFFLFTFIVATAERVGWLLTAWTTNSLLSIISITLILLLSRKTKS